MSARFASVVLDVDSTVVNIEGVDWLAARRGPVLAAQVAALTARAMAGELPLESVYSQRLDAIRPTRADVAALADAYRAAVAPGADTALARVRAAGVVIQFVSGGLRDAIIPMAAALGVGSESVHAVAIRFDAHGNYAGTDMTSLLTMHHGKAEVVRELRLTAPVLAVGDGATDAAMRPVVDAFAAFTGFVRREQVVAAADYELASFDELATLVLG